VTILLNLEDLNPPVKFNELGSGFHNFVIPTASGPAVGKRNFSDLNYPDFCWTKHAIKAYQSYESYESLTPSA